MNKRLDFMSYVNCNLCPRQCGVDRTTGETGFCGCPNTALVAKTMLHKWEEPALAGSGGSGGQAAAQHSQNLEALVGTTVDTAPKAAPKHPVNDTTTSKFANLQFGRNYDVDHK